MSTSLAATQVDREMVLAIEATTTVDLWESPDPPADVSSKAHDSEERTDTSTITLVMDTLLSVADGDFDYSEDELQAVAETTAQFAMLPFRRQQLHDLTSRLGLAALVLPLPKTRPDRGEARV